MDGAVWHSTLLRSPPAVAAEGTNDTFTFPSGSTMNRLNFILGEPMKKLSANGLRFLAEKADGIRNQTAYLVVAKDGTPDVVAKDDFNGRTPILEIETPLKGSGITAAVDIRLLYDGVILGGEHDLDKADAVFVTQSAIEKFCLPYYMRFMTAAEVDKLQNDLYNDDFIAAYHIHPSITEGFAPDERPRVVKRDKSMIILPP